MSEERTLPVVNDDSRAFWTSGAEGALRIMHCHDCGRWQHPPQPVCSHCLSWNVKPDPVSGKAVVWNYTVNYRAWRARLAEPYAIAIVELAEDPSVRMTTKLVNVDPEKVRIGMEVEVVFERDEDVWLPFFQPAQT